MLGVTSRGLGQLEQLLAEPDVSEVMVNGGSVWVERRGCLERCELTLGAGDLRLLVDRLASAGGVRVDRASPLADLRLPDGSRANVVLPPVALGGPHVTIRRFVLRRAALTDFGPPELARLLQAAVQARRDIVVVGGTSSGKTTLLNALAAAIPAGERVVTVEDTAELVLDHPHVVGLQARRPNADGVGELGVRRLVVNALRMRPDRIIVGEVRGAEVLDMAQAMNTGHEGSLSTCHANSPRDALRRLEAMALLAEVDLPLAFVRSQLAAAVDLIVHVARDHAGRRRVVEVLDVGDEADWATGRGLLVRYAEDARAR